MSSVKVSVSPQPATSVSMIRRVLSASTIGTIVEWYDFYAYGAAAAIVFNELFFPKLSPIAGTLAAFATFAVGFFARPFGGIIFGHFGDKNGRKPVLMWTLVIMGIASTLMGLLPTYAMVGIWAPILLILLRLIQGLGAGAEYAGAAVMSVEYTNTGKRGLFGSFTPIGVMISIIAYSAIFGVLSSTLTKEQFLVWGWRIPFLLSIIGVFVGLWIRSKIEETPKFVENQNSGQVEKGLPIIDAIKHYPKRILLATGIMLNGVHSYIIQVFLLSYLTKQLGMPKTIGMNALLISAVVGIFTLPAFGALSDRVGRRIMTIVGALATSLFAMPMFWMLDTRQPVMIYLAMVIAFPICLNLMWGPQGAFISEVFPTKIRYSGVAIAREIGGSLSGGTAPFIATLLYAVSGGQIWSIALYMLAAGILVTLSAYLLPETAFKELS